MTMPFEHSEQLREFVHQVQQGADLENYEEALEISRATVSALGQDISGGEAQKLAEWLPAGLSSEINEKSGHAASFDKTNFLEKVGTKTHTIDRDQVEKQVTTVLHTLRAAARSGELDDTIAQLPPALAAMFR